MGIRTAVKDDIQCTTAELVYGTTYVYLQNFSILLPPPPPTDDPTKYVTRLKVTMNQLKPPPVRQQLQHKSHVSNALSHCTHVFIRNDKVRKPLQPPYDGRFKVLHRDNKHFTLQLKNRTDVVSLDRFKPAHIDNSTPLPDQSTTPHSTASPVPATSTPSRVTRSGRHVRWPRHLT